MAYKIVVGYDGTAGGKAALDQAVDLARRVSGELVVTYAFGGRKQYVGAPLTPRRTLQEMGEKLLAEALAQPRRQRRRRPRRCSSTTTAGRACGASPASTRPQ